VIGQIISTWDQSLVPGNSAKKKKRIPGQNLDEDRFLFCPKTFRKSTKKKVWHMASLFRHSLRLA